MIDQLRLDFSAAAATVARPVAPRREQRVRRTSREARDATLPKLAKRAEQVLAWIWVHGPATDRQVMQGLGFTDMNAVRPRISELIDARLVVECGEVRCGVTRQRVRLVKLNGERR